MIGYKHFQENLLQWRYLHQAIIPLSMPHVSFKLSIQEAKQILRRKGAYLLRWDDNFDKYDQGEWWHIIKDVSEEISSLSKKTRYLIRKGAKKYRAEPCDKHYILSNGYPVYKAAYTRYDTFEKCYSIDDFQSGISNLPKNTEFWGVFDIDDDRLVAFSENLISSDACFYSTMWLEPEAMKNFAGYILFHEMNKYYLNERKVKYVSDGARSINHQTNIHHFLQSKFGFRKAYSKLNVVYRPGVYPIIFLLFPLRNFFSKKESSFFKKIFILLEQERIRRSCKQTPTKKIDE